MQDEEEIKVHQLLATLNTDRCQWPACVRVLKLLYPESREQVIEHIGLIFDVEKEREIEARWDLQGINEGVDCLKNFIFCGTSQHKLLTEVIPQVYGGQAVRGYKLVLNKTGLTFTIDSVPIRRGHLNLENGRFRYVFRSSDARQSGFIDAMRCTGGSQAASGSIIISSTAVTPTARSPTSCSGPPTASIAASQSSSGLRRRTRIN